MSARGYRARPQASITLGDFRILRKLGAGTMGAVYLAHQLSRDRPVALKVLNRLLAGRPNFVDRFYREAAVMATLRHPNIVRFHGAGEGRGFHYLAMEYVDGFGLPALLGWLGGRLRVGDALFVARACAAALAHAHGRKIIHRDVKPGNILVTRLSAVKLTDLGLAKPMDEDQNLTQSGTGMGTPKYMAPEQAVNAKRADHRSDLYALGAVLYHCLTGRPPCLEEQAVSLVRAKQRADFPPARHLNWEVPPRLDLVLRKLLAPDPDGRYQSCADLVGDLDGLGVAHSHLSFNPVTVAAAGPASAAGGVEILLVHGQPGDVLSVQEALRASGVPGNLHLVHDGPEALHFLRGEGRFAAAPRPHLVLFGPLAAAVGGVEVLQEIKTANDLQGIPVVVMTATPEARDLFGSAGVQPDLYVNRPEDMAAFEELVASAHGLYLTVLLEPGSQFSEVGGPGG